LLVFRKCITIGCTINAFAMPIFLTFHNEICKQSGLLYSFGKASA
jgi:hypothetical protein